MKKKIAILSINLDNGGVETIIYNLLPFLNEEFEVHLCLLNNIIKFNIDSNIKVEIFQTKKYNALLNIITLPLCAIKYKKYLKKNNVTQSLSFQERPNFIACMSKMLGWKGKVLIAENTTISQYYLQNTFAGKLGRFLTRLCYPRADDIVCCSKYVAYDLKNNIGLRNVNPQVIYNGLKLENIENCGKRGALINLTDFCFVHLGSFYEVKNHKILINAFSKIYKETNSKLILIGRGEKKDEIDKLIETLNLKNYVINLGFVENPHAILMQCNCFVLSSNYEGLPTVLIEAMTLGLPIVSTDCFSGPREILASTTDYKRQLQFNEEMESTAFGILSPIRNTEKLAEAMKEMYKNYSAYNNKEAIKNRVKEFAIENSAKKYIEIVNKY